MSEIENKKRYRVNVSTTSKGLKSYDCTVEIEGDQATLWDILVASDELVAELDQRYGAEQAKDEALAAV